MGREKNYKIGSKNSVNKLISKRLDRKIKRTMQQLKKDSRSPDKVTYLYASDVLGGKR